MSKPDANNPLEAESVRDLMPHVQTQLETLAAEVVGLRIEPERVT